MNVPEFAEFARPSGHFLLTSVCVFAPMHSKPERAAKAFPSAPSRRNKYAVPAFLIQGVGVVNFGGGAGKWGD